MKKFIGVITFLCSVLIYYLIGCLIFPVDENNYLQAPDFFPILGFILAAVITFIVVKMTKRKYIRSSKLGKKLTWMLTSDEKKYEKAVLFVRSVGYASVSAMQFNLGVSWNEGCKLMKKMEQNGIVSAPDEHSVRIVYGFDKYHSNIEDGVNSENDVNPNNIVVQGIDSMDGHDFEYWCANLLRLNGYEDVEVTPGSGDHGVDVLAVKDGVHYAIQCKCYSHDLGNTPVQEVYAGKEMYKCQVGVVMTNRYFTAGAKQLAEQTRVLLWDRDKLKELIDSAI